MNVPPNLTAAAILGAMALMPKPSEPPLSIVESEALTIPGTPYEQRRTWKERLFSRPWRPMQATRTVVPRLPDPQSYKIGSRLFMHPQTAAALRRHLAAQEAQQ